MFGSGRFAAVSLAAGRRYTGRRMQLQAEFTALIGALENDALEYAVVGGLAVAIWGAPRATTDIDLLICRRDLGRILVVARGLGFDIVADAMKFSDGTEICRATKFEGGQQHHPDWAGRLRLPFAGRQLTVVSREILLQMKARAARPQDLADISKLREIDR